MRDHDKITISAATREDREAIYRMRHEVYAVELGQWAPNPEGRLTDPLDSFNSYIVAKRDAGMLGFISITPPGDRFSIDKYISRSELPFPCDSGLFEIRLLTVAPGHRRTRAAGLLMYAALRWVEARGGGRIVAMGRSDLLVFYAKVGFRALGRPIHSGNVEYELLAMSVDEARTALARYSEALRTLEPAIDWRLDFPFRASAGCAHGGASFEAIGEDFDDLGRRGLVINADVLDAWFPPSPKAVEALQEHLDWLLRTSPPTGCAGMIRAVSRARGVAERNILPGAGSSDLIYRAFLRWLRADSRALILDPMYGEYGHVLGKVVRCPVDRLPLRREDGYRMDLAALESSLSRRYDIVALVNPNSPTGRFVPREELEWIIRRAPASTRFWIDETYIDYAGPGQSLERFASTRENVAVCKSLSKAYALSGTRAAYLCAAPAMLDDLRAITPPWVVSLLAQVAAVKALEDAPYYTARWDETRHLREELRVGLSDIAGVEIVPGEANFLIFHLGADHPDAEAFAGECRRRGLFVRSLSDMASSLGDRAVRIAVKGADENKRALAIIKNILSGPQPPTRTK